MDYAEIIGKNTFPEEPLDSRDRRLIQSLYEAGAKGSGFNEIVQSVRSFASRSTVAVRIERLVRLGYLERKGVEGPGKRRPVRLTSKCYACMLSVQQSKDVAANLRSELASIRGANLLDKEALGKWSVELRERYNALFGMVGTMAVFYGTSAAGDLFLPIIAEDYKALFAELMDILRKNPALVGVLQGLIEVRAASRGVDLEAIRRQTAARMSEWASG